MSKHKRRKSTHRPEPEEQPGEGGPGERLQKVLAAAGVGSRRDCEELIRDGRIEVDRQVVTELGTRVDPLRHEIRVDGEMLRQPKRMYFAINKPIGVVTTNFDPSGRPRVIDLVPTEERVFAVGRLDRASEGLILVTNDGEFANRITHPRYGVEKTYLVRVAGSPTEDDLNRLRKGVYLSDGFCRVQSITAKKRHGQSTDLLMVLNEGRNRELRRILARVGHKVLRLKRIAVGSIKLADLPTGAWRKLLPEEVENLLRLARERRKAGKSKKKGKGTPRGTVGSALHGVPGAAGSDSEPQYFQKQALLAEPLSLTDLLRDDMDEGNIAEAEPASRPDVGGDELHFSDDPGPRKRGGVIAYEEDAEGPPQGPVIEKLERQPPKSDRGRKPQRHREADASRSPDRKPRRDKRLATQTRRASEGRRPHTQSRRASEGAPAKGERNFRSRQPETERPAGEEPRSDQGRARKKFAKPAGKKFAGPKGKKPGGGSRGKLIRTGGRKYGKPSGKPGGKFGGKRKGRR